MSQIHPQARTTPRACGDQDIGVAAERAGRAVQHYCGNGAQVEDAGTTEDLSHRPHKVSTTLTAMQEALVVELRRMLLLPLDDSNKRVYELARLGNHIMRLSIFDVENLT